MPGIHRETDKRFCSAETIVSGQSTVFINGLLAAVEGDEESHGNGRLISVIGSTVFISGKKIIVFGDTATGDDAAHPGPPTDPSEVSGDVFAYGGSGAGST